MAKRPNTAPLILSIADDHGQPVELHGTADELIDDVAQAIRTAGRAQHVEQTEALAQMVAARLSVTWPTQRAAPRPEASGDTLDP